MRVSPFTFSARDERYEREEKKHEGGDSIYTLTASTIHRKAQKRGVIFNPSHSGPLLSWVSESAPCVSPSISSVCEQVGE